MKPSLVLATLVALAAGCSGPGTVDGTVAGNTVLVNDGIVVPDTKATTALIVLGNATGLCDEQQRNAVRKNSVSLSLHLSNVGAGGENVPLTAATYRPLGNAAEDVKGPRFTANVLRMNEACGNMLPATAAQVTGGEIVVTALSLTDGGKAEGTFDLSFGADRITGSFGTPVCVADAKAGTPTCE
jgi:hypothetical protein